MEIDGPEQVEELYAMLGELRKVLVDHLQGTFKDILHDNGYLFFHKSLQKIKLLASDPGE
jgi:hypothetical protein